MPAYFEIIGSNLCYPFISSLLHDCVYLIYHRLFFLHTFLQSHQHTVLSFHIDLIDPYIDIPIFLYYFGERISNCMLCDSLHSLEAIHNQSLDHIEIVLVFPLRKPDYHL